MAAGNSAEARSRAVVDLAEKDLPLVLVRAGVNFVRRHYVLTSTYLFGMLLVLFAVGFEVTKEQELHYVEIMNDFDMKALKDAEADVYLWERRYSSSKGFFSCDDTCQASYDRLTAARATLASAQAEYLSVASDAKKSVGLFSEYGVQEVRDLFWSQMGGGTDFAMRSSKYDLLFMGISSIGSDENLGSFVVRFLFQMLMNITIGLLGALVGFYGYVWGVISSYQPSALLAIAMFFLASIAATSFVASFFIGLYGTAAGAVYVIGRAAYISNARMEDQMREQRRLYNDIRAQQQQQQHYGQQQRWGHPHSE